MAPLLLLLDLFEKISVISQRKAEANKLRVSKHFGFVWFSSFTSCWVHEMSFKIAFLYFIWTYYSATLLRWNLFMVKLFQTKWLKCSWCTFSLFSFNTNFCLGKLFEQSSHFVFSFTVIHIAHVSSYWYPNCKGNVAGSTLTVEWIPGWEFDMEVVWWQHRAMV